MRILCNRNTMGISGFAVPSITALEAAILISPPTVEYRTIPLTKGQVAYVSPHRYDELIKFKWFATWKENSQRFYAARNGLASEGEKHRVYMHRQILGLEYGNPRQGDHKDRTRTLDNTDINLRLAPTRTHQQGNHGKQRNNTSGYKGVTFYKRYGTWKAQIEIDGKNKHLGYFRTPYEAHLAYCYAAAHHFGEFACFG